MNRRRRRGTTLMEMMVVIAVGGAIFGAAVVSLSLVFRMHFDQRRQAEAAAGRQQLAQRFVADVRTAALFQTQQRNDRAAVWRFDLPGGDGQVEYHWDGNALHRVWRAAGVVQHRERFVQSSGAAIDIRPVDGEVAAGKLLELRIEPSGGNRRSAIAPAWRVVGWLGARSRFDKPSTNEDLP